MKRLTSQLGIVLLSTVCLTTNAARAASSNPSANSDDYSVKIIKIRGGQRKRFLNSPPAVRENANLTRVQPTPVTNAQPNADADESNLNQAATITVSDSMSKDSVAFAGVGLNAEADSILNASPSHIVPHPLVTNSAAFKLWIEKNYGPAKTNNPAAVVDVRGKWDHANTALSNFGIVHKEVSLPNLEKALSSGAEVAIINCPGEITPGQVEPLRDFVRNGGYLLTTDWSLAGCLAGAFPGYVSWDGAYSNKEIVDGVVVDRESDILKGTVPRAPWKLDEKSQIVKVLRPGDVEVLVRSRTLTNEDPYGKGILALTFPFGKGRILHLVGHFDTDSDASNANMLADAAPEIKISLRQAIAANFVLMGLATNSERK